MFVYKFLGGGGGLRVKIGHHKTGTCAEIGQNRIRGGWGVKKSHKTSDIIYVRSLIKIISRAEKIGQIFKKLSILKMKVNKRI